ncbi:hypothetical protein H6P81_017838 [Aristolochia fimbriata]|uniref:F-box/LRR-repeat protein 15-like leucin rich repeat domain-containing protein n=1 Tax=Aristolochia fimbriata TaxID=158543 RepID=A0AAV7E148_ARIFI|nr:hypothetical protein H6P81_017838 [Aristolochia fimbriata]
MAESQRPEHDGVTVCINEFLMDDELRAVLAKLDAQKDKDVFGLVCKRWLNLQSSERKKLCARAGPLMLQKLAARFTRILELDLSQSIARSFYPGVTDSDLSVVAAGFGCLRILSLQNCKGITDNGIMALGKGLPSLLSLDVSYCRKVSDKGLVALAQGCPKLRSLHLAGCKLVTNGLLEALSEGCRDLEELGLQGCFNINDKGLEILVDGCRRIKHLDLNKCTRIGDLGISKVSEFCSSSVKILKLLDCHSVGNDSIFSIAQNCRNLETLVIGGCRSVSDESIKCLASTCGNSLKSLRMDWCPEISDSSLRSVFSHCRNLEFLDIGCCHEVTDRAFTGLDKQEFESALRVLKASGCSKITVSGVSLLLQFCKRLEYLDLRSCPHVTEAECALAGLEFPLDCKVNFTGSLLGGDLLSEGVI